MEKGYKSIKDYTAMKNLSAFIILAAALAPATLKAETPAYVPYIGLDYAYVSAKASRVKPHYNAAQFNIGTKYNPYFGTELFYQQSGSDSKKIASGKFKSSYRAYGLDVNAYMPLGCYQTTELFATAGIGEYVFKQKFAPVKHKNNGAIGYRIGGGLLYNLTDNVSFRLGARYVGLDRISNLDHMTEYFAGLRYYFL